MPPPKNNNPNQKKKKKGHTPAHQNKFAFKHNPKSKTTDKILDSLNVHVCRRCHDKIEWRKQYRKYKPRSQPGACNGCKKRNVLAAYHTICESCTRNFDRAKEIIEAEWKKEHQQQQEEGEEQLPPPPAKLRACAMCVKEIALSNPDDEEEEALIASMGKIRLRELKTLERQLAKEPKTSDDADDTKEEDTEIQGLVSIAEDDDEKDDPFLNAVGGVDKLLTGEAYQKALLEQQQQGDVVE